MLIVPGDMALGFLGGLMIGAAAALMLLLNGRIAGVSGLLGLALSPRPADRRIESAAFVAGLIGAPVLWGVFAAPPEIGLTGGTGLVVAAGLLVGVGTRMGNGCTSGHGVCGLSRGALRSLAAVLCFMGVAAAAASLLRPALLGG